jgi:hypothetical protein
MPFDLILLQLLPNDILRHIIPFTYQPQKKELLEQIRANATRMQWRLRFIRGLGGLAYCN